VNLYSTTETGPVAWECAQGRFHVLVPDVWVESLGGELVVTRLRPGATPILRYRTGDGGTMAETSCRCGTAGPSIIGFRGRVACRFRRADGVEVDAWQLAPLLRDLPLRGFRVTQLAATEFLVEGSDHVAARVRSGLVALGFAAPVITIGRGAPVHGAKPEPFRSLVNSSAAASR
jgi:phenylacetate-CoA ligase